jgi:hypothetical protein
MRLLKIFMVFFVFLIIQTAFANELSLGEININVASSVEIDLMSDYQVNVSSINVGSVDNLDIISGQSLLLKYRFLNRLDATVEVDFWFDGISQEVLDNIDIFLLEEAISEKECISKNGEIFTKNNEIVKITNNGKNYYLCNIKEIKETQKINFILNPERNNKYFLFKSGPKVFGKDGLSYNINSFVDIKKQEDIQETKENTVDKDTTKTNINLQETNTENLKESTQNQIDNFINKSDEFKSGVSGFVTLGISQTAVVIFGLLLVVVLSMFLTRKKNNYPNVDDLNRL